MVESDLKGAINHIMSGDLCFNEFGLVLEYIYFFVSSVNAVFNFVSRACNWVANKLVRHAHLASYFES